jgi:hypothetical protein
MEHAEKGSGNRSHYGRLLVMTVASFIAMYVLMYAMVDRFANVYPNFNQFYMAGLMAAAMVAIELVLMGGMYPNKKLNALLVAASLAALALFWILVRQQTLIREQQFLKSMIPHHAGAILMCREATLQDAELVRLCEGIVRGQQAEIDQMKAKLRELEK